jgi:hypothetical protein
VTQLASYFTEALSNIEPGDDARNAKSAHEEVRATLLKSTDLTDLGIDPVLIGSYKRHVSIRRVKDVDVFGRLKDADSDLAPGAALDLFEKALEVDFAGRIEPQARSFKIDFPDEELTVDVVPARPSGNHWEIPKKEAQDKRAGWLATNPLQFNELTTAANAEFLLNDKGIYVPTVKLVRQVRRNYLRDAHPGGFFFEVMTYWAFVDGAPKETSQAAYLVFALEQIVETLVQVAENGLADPTLPDKIISTRADAADLEHATARLTEARDLAAEALRDEDDCASALKWQELLGLTTEDEEVFPLPEYCNPDGSTKKSDALPGALVSPAGTGRYA